MTTLEQMIEATEKELHDAADYMVDWHVSWDDWFERNARYFRRAIGELIMKAGDGSYTGAVGNHWLELCGVTMQADDGYRGLLVRWVDLAKQLIAEQKAVQA